MDLCKYSHIESYPSRFHGQGRHCEDEGMGKGTWAMRSAAYYEEEEVLEDQEDLEESGEAEEYDSDSNLSLSGNEAEEDEDVGMPLSTIPGNQTALCSELQTLVQDYGAKTICNISEASCNPNLHVTRGPPNRNDLKWGTCYCDQLCKVVGDCCVDLRHLVNCTFNKVYDPFRERCLPVHSSRSNSNKTNMTDQCWGPRFPSHELVVLSNNSVFIIPHSKLYNNDSYILVNQTLILCINFTRNYTSRNYTKKVTPTYNNEKPPSHAHALRILTYVGSSLSIIALLFLLVTYFLFAELRTYPGKMVMHLSCAMIAMQSVYFASDPDVVSSAVLCCDGRLVALLHLGFILVDECYRPQHTENHLNPDLFSWALPLVVVGICVTLQITNAVNVGYGNADGCQLSLPSRTFAVAVPVSAMLVFNIVALIRTAVAIKLGQLSWGSPGSCDLCWLFYPTPYLEFPFVIINSCQGVLICMSFVFKKHVFTLYKQRFMVAPQPEPAATNGDEQQAGRVG
ncbi:hypothetical protein OS493_020704 [Desmophyllum pertusum]|uniref:Uncharacterized protein n=1 Tax=Desmophyllum pertusum TaxID=174260 RepID=A0A9W9YMR9_9CNID|nr:hypothetical protein OS493_020704 [Desmophyllum pertusum]